MGLALLRRQQELELWVLEQLQLMAYGTAMQMLMEWLACSKAVLMIRIELRTSRWQ